MKTPFLSFVSLLKRLGQDERGVTATIVALSITALLGVGIAGVDMGRLYVVQRQLQMSADDAALAGAAYLQEGEYIGTPSCATAGSVNADVPSSSVAAQCAGHFSARQGGQNDFTGLKVTVTPTPQCLKSVTKTTSVTCDDGGSPPTFNAIEVTERASVPIFMGKLLGYPDGAIPITAKSTAAAKGGQGKPLDIMVVVDATGSMQSGTDQYCFSTGGNTINGIFYSGTVTNEKCALLAVQSLLQGLDPHYDNVGLLIFPGVTSSYFGTVNTTNGLTGQSVMVSGIPYATTCGETLGNNSGNNANNNGKNSFYGPIPTSFPVSSAPFYTAVNFENGYKGELTSSVGIGTNIDVSDPLSIALGSCKTGPDTTHGGVYAYGQGTYYVGVLAEAANDLTLVNDGNQKVLIILTDGDANGTKSEFISGTAASVITNECQQAGAVAHAASDAGIWVYTVSYATATAGCSSDTGTLGSIPVVIDGTTYNETAVNQYPITPCQSIQGMATSPQYFFSGTPTCTEAGEGGNSTSIVELFEELAAQLTPERLIENSGPTGTQ